MDGKVLAARKVKVNVPANSSAVVYRAAVEDLLAGVPAEEAYVRFTYTDPQGEKFTNVRFFTNQKYVRFLNPKIDCKVTDLGDCKEVRLVSDVFARALYLSVKDSDILHFSDNFFDLHPGQEYVVTVKTDIPADELAERLQYNTVNAFLYY